MGVGINHDPAVEQVQDSLVIPPDGLTHDFGVDQQGQAPFIRIFDQNVAQSYLFVQHALGPFTDHLVFFRGIDRVDNGINPSDAIEYNAVKITALH